MAVAYVLTLLALVGYTAGVVSVADVLQLDSAPVCDVRMGLILGWGLLLLGLLLLLVGLPLQRRVDGPVPAEAYRCAYASALVGLAVIVLSVLSGLVRMFLVSQH